MGSALTGCYTMGIPLNGGGMNSQRGGGGGVTQVLNGYPMPDGHEERGQ